MRSLLPLLALALVGCDGGPIVFQPNGVRLGMTQEEVEALRPDLRPKTAHRGGALDREAGAREVFERYDPDEEITYEAYAFERGHLRVIFLGYGEAASLDAIADAIGAANGKPDQDVSTGGGRAVGWERAANELHLLRLPGKNEWKHEDEDGDPQTIRVAFLLWFKARGEEGGGAMRWIWVAALFALGLVCLGSVLTLRKRLESGIPPSSSVPFKVVASLSSLACAGGYGAGLVLEVLTVGDGLVVLFTLAPALALNVRLEKEENLRSSSLRASDDAPEAFNG